MYYVFIGGGYLLAYYMIGYYLPNAEIPFIGSLCRRFRAFICKHLFVYAGSWINVQRKVYWGLNNKIRIGNGSGLGANFHLQNCNLTIGENVMIAPNVKILGGGHRFDDVTRPIGEQGNYPKSNLVIDDGVWIGNSVTILGKVKRIGKGTVVGACSVVTKDIPDYCVVAGNPAKIIRYRK